MCKLEGYKKKNLSVRRKGAKQKIEEANEW
jgi:hypothetical protein